VDIPAAAMKASPRPWLRPVGVVAPAEPVAIVARAAMPIVPPISFAEDMFRKLDASSRVDIARSMEEAQRAVH
jgi:hypothetical protein